MLVVTPVLALLFFLGVDGFCRRKLCCWKPCNVSWRAKTTSSKFVGIGLSDRVSDERSRKMLPPGLVTTQFRGGEEGESESTCSSRRKTPRGEERTTGSRRDLTRPEI